MHIQICLVSDQLLANYLPILMKMPQCVHIVSTAVMQQKGMTARFESMLHKQQIDTVTHHDMPDARMNDIHAYAQKLYTSIQNQTPASITLNITGGNKLMAVGMLDIFGAAGAKVIYTDTANNRIEYLSHRVYDEPLPYLLDIPQYLHAYGAIFQSINSDDPAWQKRALERRHMTLHMARLCQQERQCSLITVLNGMAGSVLPNGSKVLKTNPTTCFDAPVRSPWSDTLNLLQATGLIRFHDQQWIEFLDEERTQYIKGNWLEEFAYHTAMALEGDDGWDVGCNVQIQWLNSDVRNELDLVIVYHNRLLVMECKTLRFDTVQKASDSVYKLDSIGERLRGAFGTKVLLSALPVPKPALERATSQGITVIRPWEWQTFLEAWKAR